MTDRFDVIVIGSGSGGLTAAIGLSRFGKRVGLVERGPVGGDCTNTGCIPSKRLIHLSKGAPPVGQRRAILDDVRRTRDTLSAKERVELERDEQIELIDGSARFAGPRVVEVEGPTGSRTISAADIVVATGSRPRALEIPGLTSERRLTNENLFELEAVPGHLAIVGAGAIGLEMACAFRRLGARVTVVDVADRVLASALPEASQVVGDALAERGVEVLLASQVAGYEPPSRTLRVLAPDGERQVDGVDAVLVAVGRTPNVEELGLDAVGVDVTPLGIVVDRWGRTSAKGIWACGDVTPGSHTTHQANALGRRIIQRIAVPWLPPIGGLPPIPEVVFSDPEIAWVGPSRSEIDRRCRAEVVSRITIPLADTDRGLTDDVTRGFISIDAVRLTGRIISATVVGPHASEIIAPLTLAMARKVSLLRLSRLVYAYPTFAGAIGAAADAFARQTLPHLPREMRAYLRHRWRRGVVRGSA